MTDTLESGKQTTRELRKIPYVMTGQGFPEEGAVIHEVTFFFISEGLHRLH